MKETLEQIAEEIITGMLSLPVTFPVNAAQKECCLCHCARIRFSGGSTGELRLSACFEGAAVLARGMLPGGIVPDRECALDTLGEVANIFAGSVKALLPDGVLLSTPEVCRCKQKLPAPNESCQFEAGGQLFELSVLSEIQLDAELDIPAGVVVV